MSDGITVRGVHIPDNELDWRFTTSGGPGGQHANRSNTAVELRFNVEDSQALPDRLKGRIRRRLAGQLTNAGEVIVQVAETRSQTRNRQQARRQLADILDEAIAPPRKRRKPTRPSKAAKRRRLQDKRHRSQIKQNRRTPEW